ncbi:MAG: hypothetical protein O9248_00790 [Rhodobacteraceae bacterium]|nr:hypothetical protein [Paracoccaceae bacterium]
MGRSWTAKTRPEPLLKTDAKDKQRGTAKERSKRQRGKKKLSVVYGLLIRLRQK